MWIHIESSTSASPEKCKGTFPQHDSFSGPLCPTSELNTVSCTNGGLLFWNAEEKFVTLFLTSWLNFFPQCCNVDFLKFWVLIIQGRLCYAVASSHSPLSAEEGGRKLLRVPWYTAAPQSHWACVTTAHRFIHWKARGLWETSYGLSEQGHRRTRMYMASDARFYVCFCVVRVMLLLSFIRLFAV